MNFRASSAAAPSLDAPCCRLNSASPATAATAATSTAVLRRSASSACRVPRARSMATPAPERMTPSQGPCLRGVRLRHRTAAQQHADAPGRSSLRERLVIKRCRGSGSPSSNHQMKSCARTPCVTLHRIRRSWLSCSGRMPSQRDPSGALQSSVGTGAPCQPGAAKARAQDSVSKRPRALASSVPAAGADLGAQSSADSTKRAPAKVPSGFTGTTPCAGEGCSYKAKASCPNGRCMGCCLRASTPCRDHLDAQQGARLLSFHCSIIHIYAVCRDLWAGAASW